jgi:Xaa-Pro aminopeptidase
MFSKEIYIERRKKLREQLESGLIVFVGNRESAMNYPGNPYHFRQDSSFLYFFGLDLPGFDGIIDIDENRDYIFGNDFTVDDVIWTGPQPTVSALSSKVGVDQTGDLSRFTEKISTALKAKRVIHFLPPYRAENSVRLSALLGISPEFLKSYMSIDLIRAVVAQRSIKSDREVQEIEKALDISYDMYAAAMRMARPGIYESEIVGKIEGIVGGYGSHISFPTILSIHGETLHNHYHGNKMEKDHLLVIDSGAESPEHYASDITRTLPVGGRFTSAQREIYEIVLKSQLTAIEAVKPEKNFKEIHLQVAEVMVDGLKGLGLMKGDAREAVSQGAHALFYPHGLGHMMGLDVHDMEDIGEDFVGYDKGVKRSDQFGLAYLRLAKELKPGYVFTVEPGIYFIPALIDKWKSENKLNPFINYDRVQEYKNFGGIRIEDDVLVTDTGYRVLGKPIPKTISEIEEAMK